MSLFDYNHCKKREINIISLHKSHNIYTVDKILKWKFERKVQKKVVFFFFDILGLQNVQFFLTFCYLL